MTGFGEGRQPMKISGRALAITLFAVTASGYAGIGTAGPHGGAAGFHATSGGRFGINGLSRNGIMGTGVHNGIMGTGVHNGIMGTGVHGITRTGDFRTSALRGSRILE